MKVYTKLGDAGETGLLFGGRVSKADPRCEAYGAADSAVSAMGLARALCTSPRVKEVLLKVQREMFTVGAELATDPAEIHRLESRFSVVTAEMVRELELLIDEVDDEIELPPPRSSCLGGPPDQRRWTWLAACCEGPSGGLSQ